MAFVIALVITTALKHIEIYWGKSSGPFFCYYRHLFVFQQGCRRSLRFQRKHMSNHLFENRHTAHLQETGRCQDHPGGSRGPAYWSSIKIYGGITKTYQDHKWNTTDAPTPFVASLGTSASRMTRLHRPRMKSKWLTAGGNHFRMAVILIRRSWSPTSFVACLFKG